jgi:putative glutamine amidotransferase
MGPVIGITQCLDDRGRWRPGRSYAYADLAYARAVEEAGGLPLHLPAQTDSDALASRIDGLLVPGGDDFAPERPDAYPSDAGFDPAPLAQIAFDRRLLASARGRNLPVLGICYGMQLLALERGGSLHYHLPTDLPEAGIHRLPETERHALEIEPETLLSDILGGVEALVNSLHHQAVSQTGLDLRVCARAPDGVIEAIEASNRPFELGVQWHPEKLAGETRDRLFRAFVDAC